MASNTISKRQYAELKGIFALFDIDDDGRISVKELKTIMKSLGQKLSDAELNNMLSLADANSDGTIDFSEFVKITSGLMNTTDCDDELLEAFKVFDKDGNGCITRDELKRAMISLGEELNDQEIDKMFKAADINNDGKINYDGII